MIRALELSVPARRGARRLGRARLRVTWDDRERAVDRRAGRALLRRRHALQPRRARVPGQGVPHRHPLRGDRVHLRVLLPDAVLPLGDDRARGRGDATSPTSAARCATSRFTDPPNHVGYFHATYRDHPQPEIGQDLVLLDTREAEGGGDWSGSFVGTSFIFSPRRRPQHARRRPALLLRRQPDAAGLRHRHRGVGRRRRLLGRPQHDAAVRRPPGRRADARGGEGRRTTRSSRPTASCSPT